jgi:hypothetical protein
LAVKTVLVELPEGKTWQQLIGTAFLATGFTHTWCCSLAPAAASPKRTAIAIPAVELAVKFPHSAAVAAVKRAHGQPIVRLAYQNSPDIAAWRCAVSRPRDADCGSG